MGGDITGVKDDYGVDGTGAVVVGVLAGKRYGVAVGNRSLAALAANLLGRHLAKGAVHVGDWERTPLSDEQVSIHYRLYCAVSVRERIPRSLIKKKNVFFLFAP